LSLYVRTAMQILSIDGVVLYEDKTVSSMGRLVEQAVSSGIHLEYANLRGAYLASTNLNSAKLRGADLTGTSLRGCDLRYADFERANLLDTSLAYCSLDSTYLVGANLKGARLPSPPMVLLANWGELSDELTADLMVWDSLNHPTPEAFDDWAIGSGKCPYIAYPKVTRSANFMEQRVLWGKGKVCPPYKLMERVLAEKCPDW